MILALFLLGGNVIHGFAFALLVGFTVGTYSSIFIASAGGAVLRALDGARAGSARAAVGAGGTAHLSGPMRQRARRDAAERRTG